MGADAVRAGLQKSVNDYIRETHTRSSLVPRPLPDFISQQDKVWERPRDEAIHAGQRRACVGHLSQSSRPQTVSAV